MERILYRQFTTRIGVLSAAELEGRVVRVSFGEPDPGEFLAKLEASFPGARIVEDTEGSSEVLREVVRQIREYLEGNLEKFDIPMHMVGTDFQKRVWEAIAGIPYGEVRTYGDLALDIEHPRAARAVGGACNRNPLPILVPCHRVVGADNSLTGFGGGLDLKRQLLELEKKHGV